MPDEGCGGIVRLHDARYGALAPALRLGLPFIPHFTVGRDTDPAIGKGLADALNARRFAIGGTIDALEGVRYADERVRAIERLASR